jgi:hypothetical protein
MDEQPFVFNLKINMITIFNKTAKVNERKAENTFGMSSLIEKIMILSQSNDTNTFFDSYFQHYAKNNYL